jgi:AcrR family transcriptional regulator
MGRRSDHTRGELTDLMVREGHRQLAEVGLSRFSAREVAKRVGYSIGTLYNVFGSFDGLMLAINARTLGDWARHLRARLADGGPDRVAVLVHSYFEFATDNPRTWIAVYGESLVDGGPAPQWYQEIAADLMSIVVDVVAGALPPARTPCAPRLARSLVATVHGHCVFALYRTFDMLGETAPVEAALQRVREAIAAAAQP